MRDIETYLLGVGLAVAYIFGLKTKAEFERHVFLDLHKNQIKKDYPETLLILILLVSARKVDWPNLSFLLQ